MRPANASAKFSVVSSQFAGKRVLVVDDVATTGATLTAMTRCLLENKAAVVYAAVLARTDGAMNNDNESLGSGKKFFRQTRHQIGAKKRGKTCW